MRVLVTGGAGYIGSHTVLQLMQYGEEVLIVDDFSNSNPMAVERIRLLVGQNVSAIKADVTDPKAVEKIFVDFKPDSVVHFAGLKAVGESTSLPLKYYSKNVYGTIVLLEAMSAVGCSKLVFSSSATVYGEPRYLPFDEEHPLKPMNPYGRTKLFSEEIIRDWCNSTKGSSAAILRYFNPVGAHSSGLIGENPSGPPNNIMPIISKVAAGEAPMFRILGNDYPTRDGTGERDYIHVEDLAGAHVAALSFITRFDGCDVFNIGTGVGVTVTELIVAFQEACGRTIRCEVGSRRPGDVSRSIASPEKAARLLGWRASLGLNEMCRSAWKWQTRLSSGR